MTQRWSYVTRGAVAALLVLAYALLSHLSTAAGTPRYLGALLAVTPPAVIALLFAWRSAHPLAGLALVAVLAGLLWQAWPFIERNFSFGYLLQQSATYALLGISFGRTLRQGRVPLCTQWADLVHGPLTPAELRYSRQVTIAWTAFFAAILLLNVALYYLAPLRLWSAFSNLAVPPLILAMFVAEYLVRRRVLPQLRRVGFFEAFKVFSARHG
jgi:uncharacterized membrane protein